MFDGWSFIADFQNFHIIFRAFLKNFRTRLCDYGTHQPLSEKYFG